MDNIIKCPSCKKTVIGEEEYSHICTFGIIEIPVIYFYTIKQNNDSMVVAKGTNGKFYRLVKLPHQNQHTKGTHSDDTKHRIVHW